MEVCSYLNMLANGKKNVTKKVKIMALDIFHLNQTGISDNLTQKLQINWEIDGITLTVCDYW